MVTVGWPMTVRGDWARWAAPGRRGCTVTVAPTWSRKSRHASPRVHDHSAPALMVTVGPVMTMLAPLPFWM